MYDLKHLANTAALDMGKLLKEKILSIFGNDYFFLIYF